MKYILYYLGRNYYLGQNYSLTKADKDTCILIHSYYKTFSCQSQFKNLGSKQTLLDIYFVLLLNLWVVTTGQQTSVTDPPVSPLGRVLEDYIQREITKRLREANVDMIKDEVSRMVEQEVERRMKKIEKEQLLRGKNTMSM